MGIAVGKAAQKAVYTMDVMAGTYIRITARERNDATYPDAWEVIVHKECVREKEPILLRIQYAPNDKGYMIPLKMRQAEDIAKSIRNNPYEYFDFVVRRKQGAGI